MCAVGLILLAAGRSTRLGRPKQLLPFEGETLVRRAARTALASVCRPVVAVLGASADTIGPELAGFPLQIVPNPDWESGMASSLRTGLAAFTPTPDAVIVMLCDQPLVSPALLDTLVQTRRTTSADIVACEYDGHLGVPALFGRTLFEALAALQGDEGARRVIRDYAGTVEKIPFPDGRIDVDTLQDYDALRRT